MEEPVVEPKKEVPNTIVPVNKQAASESKPVTKAVTKPTIAKAVRDDIAPRLYDKPVVQTQEFDNPKPWSKITRNDNDMYPYKFYIKIMVPSLKDYEAWKQVIPNLDLNPITKEIIIPSKDEASALAVANLILINFSGQMSLENILEKNLLQISIAKAKSHEMVQSKLREQIMENLFGKSLYVSKPNFESDLAKNKVQDRQLNSMGTKQPQQNSNRVNFQNENFEDTFEHFSIDSSNSGEIEAFDGGSYSFI